MAPKSQKTTFSTLEFEAGGELLDSPNDAYIKLLEFVHDRERRMNDSHPDQEGRAALQRVLNEIVRLSNAEYG